MICSSVKRLLRIVDLLVIDSTISWREFRGAGHAIWNFVGLPLFYNNFVGLPLFYPDVGPSTLMVIKMDALGQFGWNVFGSFVGSSLIIFFLIGIVKFSEAGIRRNITRESDIVKRLVEKFGSPTNDRLLNLLSPSDTEFKERWLNHRKRCGIAELWFVGGNKGEWWTNQLVIHNMESGRVLQDWKWRCWWRRGIPRTTGGENTFVEDDISTGQALVFWTDTIKSYYVFASNAMMTIILRFCSPIN